MRDSNEQLKRWCSGVAPGWQGSAKLGSQLSQGNCELPKGLKKLFFPDEISQRFLLLTPEDPVWYTKSRDVLLLWVKGHCKIYRANKYSEILPVSQAIRVRGRTRCYWAFLKSFLTRNNRMNASACRLIGVPKIWCVFSFFLFPIRLRDTEHWPTPKKHSVPFSHA